jgi:hypothetical protein
MRNKKQLLGEIQDNDKGKATELFYIIFRQSSAGHFTFGWRLLPYRPKSILLRLQRGTQQNTATPMGAHLISWILSLMTSDYSKIL